MLITNNNRTAFLSMIAFAEGTSTNPVTSNNGYDIIVTGIGGKFETFNDYTDHPFANGRKPKQINRQGLKSTASGRYQILIRDWFHYKGLLDLSDKNLYPDGAFSPQAQDAYALQLIKECRALSFIDEGKIEQAINKVKHLWASFPGAGYDQKEQRMAVLIGEYLKAGGVIA